MTYYAGLDVSLKETFVSIIDENGKVVKENMIGTSSKALSAYLKGTELSFTKVGIESGQLSISLCKGLKRAGLPVICVDARHMAAALSARINKNDKNDARGIAQMLRANLYKTVHIKSDTACDLKMLLGSHRQLIGNRQRIMGEIRGLLKIQGIKLGTQSKFCDKVIKAIEPLSFIARQSIELLLNALEATEESSQETRKLLKVMSEKDESCVRLMTTPGVGPITAITYKTSLDNLKRFKKSATVGAYLGLTPRQYASGEVDRHGRISKMGPKECRSMLYEAAVVLLTRTKKHCKLKAWGLRLAKKKGMKKAVVATARKLSVMMHAMLVSGEDFCYGRHEKGGKKMRAHTRSVYPQGPQAPSCQPD